ncbi:purple acid phosphatase family protein [Blastopirellula marina]|uniref:Metallophosphoesterase n=1 Tax=Blastopirellula marina TaxID=124 RepID=A0A2S8GTW3_9BACT|nr:metallophosphoesterase family protein [Blastopirellula marina]PQO47863.1 metallophosphoesterase [Blastopirellula marina]
MSKFPTVFLLIAVVFGCQFAAIGLAHDGEDHHHHPAKIEPAEFYAPTAMPDRVVLTWTGDPTKTQAVTWRTSTDVKKGLAEIAVATGGPKFDESAKQLVAKTQPLETDINTAHFHTVEFEDLKPGTKYAYRVGDGENWSEWFQFSTAKADETKFSFIYFGDAQNDVRSKWSRVIREAYSDAPKAAFMLHAGDLINRAERDAEWGEWFGAGAFLNAMIPSVPVPGNHEQAKGEDGKRHLSHHWRPSFALPENGPQGLEESCYWLHYGNMLIVGMNSSEDLEVQAKWLTNLLEENEKQWVVCTFHHPVFSTGKGRDNAELRNIWKPIFDKYKVDLVLQGHDHTYGRTGLETPLADSEKETQEKNLPTGVNNFDEQTGTVYVVSVSGPKMYSLNAHPFMNSTAANTQLYQIISVDGDTIKYEARTAVGDVHDSFTLKKRDGEINELIEGPVVKKDASTE